MEQEDMTAPELILKQLGGKRFMIMVGEANIIEGNRTLSFHVKRNSKDVTHVHIVKNVLDLFDVKSLKVSNAGVETLHES